MLLPLLIGFAVTQLRPLAGIAAGTAVVLCYSALAIGLYATTLYWIDLIHVDAATLFAALFVALYRVVTEGADKRVIRAMFGKHVSPALVDQMLAHDDPLKALDLSGKRAKVTVFYSDIRGFTAMSETMTPEAIYGALNEYFEEMCRLVFEHGGYVDKFIGDCLMAVFSAPNPRPDDAYEAVMSAWKQQQKILAMMTEWAAQGRQIFTVGMGLNTGEVVLGNLGSSDRLNYTVIGDNVNTAARLYNVAKGGQIIISESTYEEVKERFVVNELTPVSVKGKTAAAAQLRGRGHPRTRPDQPFHPARSGQPAASRRRRRPLARGDARRPARRAGAVPGRRGGERAGLAGRPGRRVRHHPGAAGVLRRSAGAGGGHVAADGAGEHRRRDGRLHARRQGRPAAGDPAHGRRAARQRRSARSRCTASRRWASTPLTAWCWS